MPMEYLQGLERDDLPLIETDASNIDKLRVLHAAGMVEVLLPALDASQPKAKVLYITGLGCATLRLRHAHRSQLPQTLAWSMQSTLD